MQIMQRIAPSPSLGGACSNSNEALTKNVYHVPPQQPQPQPAHRAQRAQRTRTGTAWHSSSAAAGASRVLLGATMHYANAITNQQPTSTWDTMGNIAYYGAHHRLQAAAGRCRLMTHTRTLALAHSVLSPSHNHN
jgi:hypothetical protein